MILEKWQKFSDEELKEIYETSSSFSEVAKKLGYSGRNGKLIEKIKKIANDKNITASFLLKQRKQVKDYIGKTINYLKIIEVNEELTKEKGVTYFRCECLNCGNTNYSISISNINKVKSCGCLHTQHFIQGHYEDLAGKIFQNLKVLEIDKEKSLKENKIYWKCLCLKCNKNIISVQSWDLKTNRKDNCGCYNKKSKGEEKIHNILTKLNKDFKQEYAFKDFYEFKGHPFRYDFAVFKDGILKYLIEYQGKQHYQDGWGEKEQLEIIQNRDRKKVEYCKNNKIPLIIIPYTDYDEIDENYLLEKEKEVNNYARRYTIQQ